MIKRFSQGIALCGVVLFSIAAYAGSQEAAAHNSAGAALLAQGKTEPAIVEFQRALVSDLNFFPARLNLAFAFEKAGRIDDAIKAYRVAIDTQPHNFLAHNNLGVLYGKTGQHDLAIARFESALTIEPGNSLALKNLENANKNHATIKEREAQIAKIEGEAEAKPHDPRASYAVARTHAVYGNKGLALEWLGKAIRQGYRDVAGMKADPAFENIRQEREFELLLLRR